ncbi:unnamed protein product [Jaminaea pallidilutea]
MADSLDANFVLESDGEGPVAQASTSKAAAVSSKSQPGQKKRRRSPSHSDDEDDGGDDSAAVAAGATTAAQKAKRKERQKARKARLAAARQEEEQSRQDPALLPPEYQVEWLRKEMKRCKKWKELSEMELDEVAVGQARLVDSTTWKGGRSAGDLAVLLKKLTPGLEELLESPASALLNQKGSPAVLVLTNDALRATDLCRGLRGLLPGLPEEGSDERNGKTKDGRSKEQGVQKKKSKTDATTTNGQQNQSAATPTLHIAKLFSRHFSPAQQTEYLASHNVAAGAGTAQRVATLLSKGSLKVDQLRLLVLDVGWRDEKQRAMLDEEGGREGVVAAWEAVKGKGDVRVLLL